MMKRIASLLLCLCMVLTMVPLPAFAAEDTAKVKAVQDLIDALPSSVTQENKAAVGDQLNGIIQAYGALDTALQQKVNLSKYEATIAAMYALEGQPGAQNPQTIGMNTLYIYDRTEERNVSESEVMLEVYGTKNGTVRVGSGYDLLQFGMERGKSYSVSLYPSNCGYEMSSSDSKLSIPASGYIGDELVNFIVFKQYDLTVMVKDSLGNIQSGKTVKVRPVAGEAVRTATTDSSGKAVFPNIRGVYQSVQASVDYEKATGGTGTVTGTANMLTGRDQTLTLTIPCETKVSVKVSGLFPDGTAKFDSDVSNATVTVKNKNNESVTLTRQSDGTYVGAAKRTANGKDTFSVTVSANGYQTKNWDVSSSGGAAISTSAALTMKAPAVQGLSNNQTLTVGEEYSLTVAAAEIPEDAVVSAVSSNSGKISVTGSSGSWKVYPSDAASAKITVDIGSEEYAAVWVLQEYQLSAVKGTIASPAAPALSAGTDNVTGETFTLPQDLKLAETVTITAKGIDGTPSSGIEKSQTYTGITAGKKLTMDFGQTLRGQVNYTFTYASSKTDYSAPATKSKGYYVQLDASSVTFGGPTTMEYNGERQLPTVSVAGLSENEYTVTYGSVVGADTEYPLNFEDSNSFRYPNGMYEFTYTFVYTNTTKPLYYYAMVSGNEAQYIKGGASQRYQITKRNLTVTAQDQVINSGESFDSTKYTVGGSGLLPYHTLSCTLTPSTTNPGTKGEIKISNVKVTQFNTDYTGYYNITTKNGTVTNMVPTDSLTVEVPQSVTYNALAQTPVVVKVDGRTLTAGTDYQAEYTNNKNAGTAKVKLTSDAWDGDPIEKTFEITKAPLTASISGADKVYNGKKAAEDAKIVLSGVIGQDEVKAAATISYADANAGSNKKVTAAGITLEGSAAKNYQLVDAAGQALNTLETTGTISRKSVTVTAKAGEKTYGEKDPETFDYTAAGLVAGETLQGKLARREGTAVGRYDILQNTLTNTNNPNYDIQYAGAKFIIKARKLTVTGITAKKEYDGTDTIAQLDLSKAKVTDTLADEPVTVASAAGKFKSANAGEAVDILLSNVTLSDGEGDYLKNYTFTLGEIQAKGTITPFAVVVTPDDNQGKTYGDKEPAALTFTLDRTLPGEENLTNLLQRETGENAGTYKISLKANTNTNYALTLAQPQKVFTIAPLALTAANTTITLSDIPYDGRTWSSTPKYEVKLGDGTVKTLTKNTDYTLTGNTAANVGTYTLTMTAKAGGNYTGSFETQWKIVPPKKTMEDVRNGTITADNVSLTQKEALEKLQEALDSVNQNTVATDAERAAWEDAEEKLAPILEKLKTLNAALNTDEVKAAEKITPDKVTADQKETLSEAKKDIQDYLDKNAAHITGAEKTTLEGKISSMDASLAEITKAEAAIKKVVDWLKEKEPKADADELDMREDLEEVQSEVDAITDANTKRIVKDAVDEKLEAVRKKLYTYKITSGDGAKWTKKSGKTLTFKANGAYSLFDHLLIDGKKLAATNYTKANGSTSVTLKAAYLETLKTGDHTIQFVYDDEDAENPKTNVGTFKIVAASVTPATGDDIMTPVTVMLVSAGGLMLLMLLKKKKHCV